VPVGSRVQIRGEARSEFRYVRLVHVEMVWHPRRDANPAHRWLREVLMGAVKART